MIYLHLYIEHDWSHVSHMLANILSTLLNAMLASVIKSVIGLLRVNCHSTHRLPPKVRPPRGIGPCQSWEGKLLVSLYGARLNRVYGVAAPPVWPKAVSRGC